MRRPRIYMDRGVTPAMTAGSQLPYQELNQKRMVDAGAMAGPRFEIAGPYIDGGPPRASFARIIETPDDARRVVDYWGTEGATWIKVMGQISRDLMAAVIEAAHVRGEVTVTSVRPLPKPPTGDDALHHGFSPTVLRPEEPDRCPHNMIAQAKCICQSDGGASIRNSCGRSRSGIDLGVYETLAGLPR